MLVVLFLFLKSTYTVREATMCFKIVKDEKTVISKKEQK